MPTTSSESFHESPNSNPRPRELELNGLTQVGADHYRWLAYNDRRRWASYWHQIAETLRLEPESCLVVGKGDGTVTDALAHEGVPVVTCDIAEELGPDVVADVRALPFADRAFDVVLCAEVLEHLPFDAFPGCLGELGRVTRRSVVLTLPQRGRSWELAIRLPALPRLHLSGKLPSLSQHRFDGQHHWEVGARNYRRSLVESRIRAVFEIEREFLVPENTYHRFYVLRPRTSA